MTTRKGDLGRLTLVATIVALAFVAACDDTPFVAPEGSTITLTASPTTVRIDEPEGEDSGTSAIQALVFDEGGIPLREANVYFASDGGSLDTNGEPVETDDNGVARATLSVGLSDEGTVTITAQSGAVTETRDVTVDILGVNQLPSVSITATPATQQRKSVQTIFRGTATDPDEPDDAVTCWRWEIISSLGGTPEVIAGASEQEIVRTYTNEQTLTVRLRASDDPGLVCSAGASIGSFGAQSSIPYLIVCDTSAPSASAGTDQSANLAGGSATVSLNGSGSSDAESGISSYAWTCGNGTGGNTAQVNCVYSTTGSFTATLTVTNGCGQTASDTATVVINP